MIIISLDEYGEFEKADNKPVFIAGFMFDDENDEWEEQRERKRIEAYYKKAILEAGTDFRYPEDLHSNGNKSRDHNVVRLVKLKVSETLPEFISKGTYAGISLQDENGKKIGARKGKYHIFVMLKSNDGKQSLLKDGTAIFAKDDYAANLYFHMASSVVNRIIFHNPIYKKPMPPIKLDISTRSSGDVRTMNNSASSEFKKQDYKINKFAKSGYENYSIMNSDVYRTIIAQEIINSGNTGIKFKGFSVNPIKYTSKSSKMEFLYLSDSICSILSYQLKGESANDWLEQIIIRVENLNPSDENLVFGYDEIDNDFSNAWSQYEQKNLYKALSIAFDGKTKKGEFAKYYSEKWFPYLEERVRSTISVENFTQSVNLLSNTLLMNNLNQEKLIYIMQQFEAIVPQIVEHYISSDDREKTLYKLYDAGLSAFCHIGNSQKAIEYYEKCKEHAFYIGIDEFLRTTNKLIVCLEDSFEWDKALELAREMVSNQELVSDLKRDIFKIEKECEFLEEAKAISQRARIMAEKHLPETADEFQRALSKMKKDSSNYKITQSYLLHFYADMGMQEEFEEELTDYFDGRKTYNQKLKYITNMKEEAHSIFSKKYAIYVLIRGLFQFGRKQIDDILWEKLCSLNKTLEENDGTVPGGHPWEITYKYLEMLAIARGDKEAQEKFRRLRNNCLRVKGDTITALEMFGDAEIANFMDEIAMRDTYSEKLVDFLKGHFVSIKDFNFSQDGNKRYSELEKYFTFMYR